MKFVQRKVTTAKISTPLLTSPSWKSNFYRMWYPQWRWKNSSRADPQLGSNWDQDCPKQHLDYGSARCQVSGNVWSKRQATDHGCFCGSLVGDFLPIRSNNDPLHWEDHCTVHQQCLASLSRIALIIMDNFKGQITSPVTSLLEETIFTIACFLWIQLITSNLWIYLWTSQQNTSWRDDLKIGTRSK